MIEVSGTSSFCSTPDALEFDESEKGIFGSLRNIAQLPPGSPKEGDRVADSAAYDTVGIRPLGSRAGSLLPLTLVSVLVCSTSFFCRA